MRQKPGMLLTALAAALAGGFAYGVYGRTVQRGPYPSPEAVLREIEELARAHRESCELVDIGHSTEGRPLYALRFGAGRGSPEAPPKPRLLVTANIHAVEYVGGCVARAIARKLAAPEGPAGALLEQAEVWVIPLLNPDGAARVWRTNGRGGIGPQRFTANGVDPNRNFPAAATRGADGRRTASARAGSTYYRGPYPLSEPECRALAHLARRQRFCAAIHFHSFGGVVFLPALEGPEREKAQHCYAVFQGFFQQHQPLVKYRAVPERSAKIGGQLDAFLFDAFGTVSVTVEVSRLDRRLLKPWRLANLFWWANPEDPQFWIDNDADAALHALAEVLRRGGGVPCQPPHPELAAL